MRFSTFFTCIGLLTSLVSATSFDLKPRAAKGQNVVYWGQNGGNTIENNDLSTYCTNTAGIDIIVLAFLFSFGSSGTFPSGAFGQSCGISHDGKGQQCDALAAAIAKCQSAGVKIILSLGGASSSFSLTSNEQAYQIGQYLWESYGKPGNSTVERRESGNTTVPRPFGNVVVNGFDFDIESSGSSQYFPAMIRALRTGIESDSSNKYYITGAPQCPIPEPNMGVIIRNATFDYLFVQWFNNNAYGPDPCALPFNGNAPFNYNDWVKYTEGTPSANAQIFIGVPAAPLAANGSPSGATYYITPQQLSQLIGQYGNATRFGGIMMWSVGFSDSNVIDGCTYAQQAHAILANGQPCNGSSGNSSSSTPTSIQSSISAKVTTTIVTSTTSITMLASSIKPTTTPTSSTKSTTTLESSTKSATTPTSSSTGGMAGQYDQCGGSMYDGPTQCHPGWVCTEISKAYSQCDPAV